MAQPIIRPVNSEYLCSALIIVYHKNHKNQSSDIQIVPKKQDKFKASVQKSHFYIMFFSKGVQGFGGLFEHFIFFGVTKTQVKASILGI